MTAINETGLDAGANRGVVKTNGVVFLVDLVEAADIDPALITEITADVQAGLAPPAALRSAAWFSGRDSAIGQNTLAYQIPIYSPFTVDEQTTIIDIGVSVLTLGTGVIRLAICDLGTTGLNPDNYLGGGGSGAGAHDFGTVSATTTGFKRTNTTQFGTPLVLAPGRYLKVAVWQGTNTTAPVIASEVSAERGLSQLSLPDPTVTLAGWAGGAVSGAFVTPDPGHASPSTIVASSFGAYIQMKTQ